MPPLEDFRRELADLLSAYAERRRARAHGRSAEREFAIAAILERLARECATLDPADYQACRVALRHLPRRPMRRPDHLLAEIGVTYTPENASDLVFWMTRRLLRSAPAGNGAAGARAPLIEAVACNFAAGFCVVAPILAVWEGKLGIEQWRDQTIADATPAVPAVVVASEEADGGRNADRSATVVLNFRPSPAAEQCQVPIRTGLRQAQPYSGGTLMVVPRSNYCEPPILEDDLGNPALTLTLSVALMVGAMGSLKLWGWLQRREDRRGAAPDWTASSLTARES